MSNQIDPLLRVKAVLGATALSHSVFYLLRARGEFPEPDAHLNGANPVWRASTVRAWIERQVELSRGKGSTHRMARRLATAHLAHAAKQLVASGGE